MSTSAPSDSASNAVFLSYASQDAEAARRICEALRAAGIEVWFDQNELVGGDAWDAKIRRQIASCALFMPIVSASTQARREGYFRIEWRLAAQRTHAMSDDTPFLLPVVIDDTGDVEARVPAEFKAVQWTRLVGGETPASFCARVKRLLTGADVEPQRAPPARGESAAVPGTRPRWKRWLGPAVAVVAIATAGLIWWPQRTAGGAARDPELQRAAALFDFNSPNSTAEGYALAEDILKAVLAKRPADVEAVVLYAWLNDLFMIRGFDNSEERRALARQYSERAEQLAPKNPDALAARGMYFSSANDSARAEALLRRAIALNPRDPRYYRMLGFAIAAQGRADEALANARHAIELFPRDALTRYDLGLLQLDAEQFEEAEKTFQATLPLVPADSLLYAGVHADLASSAAFAHADLAAMKRWIDGMPAQFRDDDREVMPLFIYACATGDTENALAALRRRPGAWLRNYGEFPKGLLAGDLLLLQGRTELARGEFEAAHAEVMRARAREPNKMRYRRLECWTQLRLGHQAEARAALQGVVDAGASLQLHLLYLGEYWYGPLAAALALGDKDAAMTLLRSTATTPRSRRYLRNMMQIDPRVKAWREDPAVAELLDDGVKPRAEKATPVDEKSVVVLPFANLSADHDNEYFSDGIADELLSTLQTIPGLRVAARTSAFSFKGRNVTVREVGERLGTAYAVEGSVQKADRRVKITARLSRTASNEEVWSKSFGPIELTDVFATQAEIAQAIVGELRGRLAGGSTQPDAGTPLDAARLGGTRNADAHQLYLQGKFLLNQFTPASLTRAEELLRRTVELDPNFGLAWVNLSNVGRLRSGFGDTRAEVTAGFEVAREASERALALAPTLGVTHLARLNFQLLAFDWQGAAASLRRVAELVPNERYESEMKVAAAFGEPERAAAAGSRAVALDPVNPELRVSYGFTLFQLGRFAEAETEFRRVAELSGAAPYAHAGTALALLMQGRAKEASIEAAKEVPDWCRRFALAITLWREGKKSEAEAVLADLIASDADVAAFQVAEVYAIRGEHDRAFEWLDRAFRQRDPGLIGSQNDFALRSLHADPRWSAFVRKLGFAAAPAK